MKNKELKCRWIAALRSGKYTRTTGSLRRPTGKGTYKHCCLGVLCDLVDSSGWTNDRVVDSYHSNGRSSSGVIPTPLREELEITPDQQSQLMFMNDSPKGSFTKIAEWIEKNL